MQPCDKKQVSRETALFGVSSDDENYGHKHSNNRLSYINAFFSMIFFFTGFIKRGHEEGRGGGVIERESRVGRGTDTGSTFHRELLFINCKANVKFSGCYVQYLNVNCLFCFMFPKASGRRGFIFALREFHGFWE